MRFLDLFTSGASCLCVRVHEYSGERAIECVCKQKERREPERRVRKLDNLGKGLHLQHCHEGDRDITSGGEGSVCKAGTVVKMHSGSFRGLRRLNSLK